MTRINLKRLCAKKETQSLIKEIVGEIDPTVSIRDREGRCLVGNDRDDDRETEAKKHPIEVAGETLGWAIGDRGGATLAKLVSHLAQKEFEKKTLANEALDKYREITLIYDLSQKLTASLEFNEVAKLVMDEVQRMMQASGGCLMLLDRTGATLETVAGFGEDPQGSTRVQLGRGIVGGAIASSGGEIVNDVSRDPRHDDTDPERGSLLCVPLKTKDRAIGGIAIACEQTETYKAADLKRLTMLASQAATAIENAILHEQKLEESRREALLFRLSSQIRYSLNLDWILETAVGEIRTLLDVDRCWFMWYRGDLESGDWEIVKESRDRQLASVLGTYRAEQIQGWLWNCDREAVIRADDLDRCADVPGRQLFQHCGLSEIVALPIRTRSGEMGVVVCGNTSKRRPWNDREVELLAAVANQLAIAVDQAQMYAEAANSAKAAQAQAEKLQAILSELQETQAQLIQSEKMSSLGQLIAGVAHEINNPVNFIYGNLSHASQYSQDLIGLIECYQKHYPDPHPEVRAEIEAVDLDFLVEDLPKIIASMQVGAERIRQIVLTLRNFSRLDEAQMKAVNLHEGIESTLLILHNRLKGKNGRPAIEIVKNFDCLPNVECYASQMNQVFMNILSNAIDALEYHPQELRKISITTQSVRGSRSPANGDRPGSFDGVRSILIRIADNGPGMSPEVKNRLFDPFFTTKPVGKGTGLGLSISYQIVVEKHGGTIQCVSQPGEGTEFWIEIPVQPGIVQPKSIQWHAETSREKKLMRPAAKLQQFMA
jgi:signal transduction histidine kinase